MTVVAQHFASQHAAHLLTLLGPVVACLAVALLSDGRAWMRRSGHAVDPRVAIAAFLSIAAAFIHLLVCPEHFHQAVLYGTFFAASAAVQLGWAALVVVRRRPGLLLAGAVGNAATVALWAVTRTVGIPLGPQRGVVETVGTLDVLCAVAEVGVVATCIWMLVVPRLTVSRPVAA